MCLSLSPKRAASAAGSQDSGMHPGNHTAGRGERHESCTGEGSRHCFSKAIVALLEVLQGFKVSEENGAGVVPPDPLTAP